MTGASGNSARARDRVVSTFAPWWAPWRWCWARTPTNLDDNIINFLRPQRCRLPRRHLNRHATYDGFDIRYFDARNEGTP